MAGVYHECRTLYKYAVQNQLTLDSFWQATVARFQLLIFAAADLLLVRICISRFLLVKREKGSELIWQIR